MKQMKNQGSKDTDELENEDDNEDLFAEIGEALMNFDIWIKSTTT